MNQTQLLDPSRHVPLRRTAWSTTSAAGAIKDIVSDTLDYFDGDRFWPAHPLDEGQRDGDASFYWGATGTIWALDYLGATDAAKRRVEFGPLMDRLLAACQDQFGAVGEYSAHGSFLFGDLGTALLVMKLAPDPTIAGLIEKRVIANERLPIRELMWGMPGSMLACVHMHGMTGEDRWRQIFARQASRLLADLHDTDAGPLWTQDLYGNTVQYLGPVHGFTGNIIPLLKGWSWLTEPQRQQVRAAIERTLASNAVRSDFGTNWLARIGYAKPLVQYCHAAPGMVTALAGAPFSSPEFEALMLGGGEFTWFAGPLAKGSNLCHGTGGNGYAFLKLFRRTQDQMWLDRARAFAMTAIEQCREARAEFGRGRYSLWTGDIGLAVYLWDCIRSEPAFPTIDVF